MYNAYLPQQPQYGRGDLFRAVPVTSNILRVSGINGVNALQIAPNQQVIACDDSADVIYFITTDSAGYKTFDAYDFTPHIDKTARESEMIEERLKRMEEMINELYVKQGDSQADAQSANP